MDDGTKYLIHAELRAEGVVDRSDVVGAIYGQTEGLLGEGLDLADLQQASRVGRIDVTVDSEGGRSAGEITVASQLDKVETSILAASLETLERVGPCEATVRITGIEDVRAAKRREVVARAKELLAEAFDEDLLSSHELVEEVRESVRVASITEFEGLPAGPRVGAGDAIIVVEGRADVLTLLRYGIKNAIAVEGTNVPRAVVELSRDRTTTAFLDGDRGGDLILRELAQLAEVEAVARAPPGRAVEDLTRSEVRTALRQKQSVQAALEAADPAVELADDGAELSTMAGIAEEMEPKEDRTEAPRDDEAKPGDGSDSTTQREGAGDGESPTGDPDEAGDHASSLAGHVRAVLGSSSGTVRLLDAELSILHSAPAEEAFEAIKDADAVPTAVIVDGPVEQRLLDIAAQRGVEQVVGRERGDYVKEPTTVRIRTADEFEAVG